MAPSHGLIWWYPAGKAGGLKKNRRAGLGGGRAMELRLAVAAVLVLLSHLVAAQSKLTSPAANGPTAGSLPSACRDPSGSDGCSFAGTLTGLLVTKSIAECKAACDGNERCVAWSVKKSQPNLPAGQMFCSPLSEVTAVGASDCCVSGWKSYGAPTRPLPSQPPQGKP